MKYIKHSLICTVLGLLLLQNACTDLDETIYTEFTDETIDLTDPEVIGSMMGEAYANFRYIYWHWEGYFDFMEECTDLYMTPKRPNGWGSQYIKLHKHTWTSTLGGYHLVDFWNFGYKTIGYANLCLDILPETGNKQAQMRFLRALTHYMLLDGFRNIPLETTMKHKGGYLPVQVPPDSVFNFCIHELEAIKDSLGTEKYHGYPNRYAACMVKAKLYLNYNAYFGTDDISYYQKALDEVNEVINEGGYSLAPHYSDNFKQDISSSPEVIFAIPLDPSHASHNYLVNKCLLGSGAAAFGYEGTPWNGSCAVPQFIDSYSGNDNRLGYTWTGGIQHFYNKEDSIPNDPNGTPIPYDVDDWSGTGYLNYSKRVHSIDNPQAYTQEGYRFIKSEIVPGTVGTYGNDVAFFRLADAMFIKAECLLRLGINKQEAADLITEVRSNGKRFDSLSAAVRTVADLEGGSVYPYGHQEYTSTGFDNWSEYWHTEEGGDDIILGGLLDDLAWEFVGEHHRRQDLIRFKMTDGRNVFNGKSWFCKDATTETKWDYYPIPQEALDANKYLKQSDTYETTAQ